MQFRWRWSTATESNAIKKKKKGQSVLLSEDILDDKAVLMDFQKDAGWIAVCSWVEGLCSMI